jgi:dTDP-6-deoxy-L-talose 4-dehydrogenase (NAD+)
MKILVTGASGGFGQIVINDLLKSGFNIIATSKDFEKAKTLDFYHKVEYIPYDIINSNFDLNLFEFFKKPDVLIHLAWNNLNDYRSELHETLILDSHKVFINNLISNGLKNINVIGTCYEYGLQEGELFEYMEPKPTLPYPIAKNKLRLYIESLQKTFHFNLKWIRIFYVFGETVGRKNLFTSLNEAIKNGEKTFDMSGGEQIRDFLSPQEISKLIVEISIQINTTGIINCCSGIPVKLKDYIQEYLQKNNSSIKLNFGVYPYANYEPMICWGSTKKLNSINSNIK